MTDNVTVGKECLAELVCRTWIHLTLTSRTLIFSDGGLLMEGDELQWTRVFGLLLFSFSAMSRPRSRIFHADVEMWNPKTKSQSNSPYFPYEADGWMLLADFNFSTCRDNKVSCTTNLWNLYFSSLPFSPKCDSINCFQDLVYVSICCIFIKRFSTTYLLVTFHLNVQGNLFTRHLKF